MSLKQVLMENEGFTEKEAEQEIADARDEALELIGNGQMSQAMEICGDRWGLEPDYLEDFLI